MAIGHGGKLDAAIARYGGSRETWLDLSTGINPNAYPVPAVSMEAWTRLPDDGAETRLLEAARAYYGVPNKSLLVMANGTQAIIEQLPRLLEFDKVAIVSPTYGEHAHVWNRAGAHVVEVSDLQSVSPDIPCVVIVNPNNPDCRVWERDQLLQLAARHERVIVDEAFCDIQPEHSLVPDLPDNVLVLKSVGKFFGLAGMRLGLAVCSADLAGRLQEMMGPWAVSGPALEIGAKAFSDADWIKFTRKQLAETSRLLAATLDEHGCEVAGVNPLFVFVKHDHARDLFEHLAQNHILVRPFDHMPDYLRFGLCKDNVELARLQKALAEFNNA